MLSDPDREIAAAWDSAAIGLGVLIEHPESEADGPWAVRFPQFGNAGGTVCRHTSAPVHAQEELRDWAEQHDALMSLLADSYRTYDRDLFVATLNDWGWRATDPPPAWYTGTTW